MSALCIYHGSCPDGFTAAWIVNQALHDLLVDDVEFHPGVYGEDPPDCSDRSVYMVDFTYPNNWMWAIADTANSLVVLDHHQTGIENCANIGSRPEGDAIVVLDMQRSGARMAWDYFYGPEEPPDIVRFVEDRDLWRFALDGTKDYFAALTSRPYTFEAWNEISRLPLSEVLAEGRAINRYRDQLIAQAVATAAIETVAGVEMLTVNCPYAYASDVAGYLAERDMESVAAYYYDDRARNVRSWGLRSADWGPDVAVIAETMGGGGHKHAAGFRTPIPEGDI